jgi:hypothetical protein
MQRHYPALIHLHDGVLHSTAAALRRRIMSLPSQQTQRMAHFSVVCKEAGPVKRVFYVSGPAARRALSRGADGLAPNNWRDSEFLSEIAKTAIRVTLGLMSEGSKTWDRPLESDARRSACKKIGLPGGQVGANLRTRFGLTSRGPNEPTLIGGFHSLSACEMATESVSEHVLTRRTAHHGPCR